MALEHQHDGHHHEYKAVTFGRLRWSLAITAVVMGVEVVGGWATGSIALVSDAGHMLTHSFAIAVSMFGILIARYPPCHHRTYGLLRSEVLAAFINGLFLIAVAAWIVFESVERLRRPTEILTGEMLVVALLGLVVNVISIVLLESSRHDDLNVRSVFMHMVGDAASSIAIVVAALAIRSTGWAWIDPAVSIAIATWVAVWAGDLLRESARVLLEMAPKGRNVHEIAEALKKRFPEVVSTSHEHLWTITPDVAVFTARLRVNPERLQREEMEPWLHEAHDWLHEAFHISESTLQVSFSGLDEPGEGPFSSAQFGPDVP